MNKYFKILLGLLLVLIPISILIKQGILLEFVLLGLSTIAFPVGIFLIYSGLSDLKEKKENKEEDLTDETEEELDDDFMRKKGEIFGNLK